jgi:hypothetical protein
MDILSVAMRAQAHPAARMRRGSVRPEKKVGRGLYVLPEADLSERHSLAQACKRVPHGVICLLSALPTV